LEWEPEERDAWVGDAERWIRKIKGVRDCKIDLDQSGEIIGVHVVSGIDREPRHIVRDVEGLLKARLDVDVYYKKIGVVQVIENDTSTADKVVEEEPTGRAAAAEDSQLSTDELAAELDDPATPAVLLAEELAPRLQCTGVGVMATEMTVRAEVELAAGGVEAQGCEEGPNHADSDIVLVAKATVAAIRALLDEPVVIELTDVKIDAVGDREIVLTALELVEGRRSERLFGTCPTSHNRHQAVVYAVLDALNRRLALMSLKLGEAIG
jgi:hypothetical protein